jgi:hypothetical protein
VRGRSKAPKPAEMIASLEAEVLLLQEENARLKAGLHGEAELETLLARARTLPEGAVEPADVDDDAAAELLAETLVIREILLELCREIQRSVNGLADQLDRMKPPAAEPTSQ